MVEKGFPPSLCHPMHIMAPALLLFFPPRALPLAVDIQSLAA